MGPNEFVIMFSFLQLRVEKVFPAIISFEHNTFLFVLS